MARMTSGTLLGAFLLVGILLNFPFTALGQGRADELLIALTDFGSETMDPSMSAASNRQFTTPMWDALIGNDPQGRLSKETGIASDWKVTNTATSSTYVINLRKGVKFHNGDPLTSADVKFSIARIMSPEANAAFKGALVKAVASIETPDPYTLVIRTKEPSGFLLYDLSNAKGNEGFVMPKKYFEQVGASQFNQHPIGTGPYRFIKHDVGNQIVYEAFSDYWGAQPKFRKLTFLNMPEETTRIAALKSRRVDIIAVTKERIGEVKEFKIVNKPGATLTWNGLITIFDEGSKFNDVRVRKALNLAINREEIRDFIYAGQATLSGGVGYGTLAVGYQPIPPYPYDPDTARKLLKEVYPNGLEIEMYQYSRSGAPEMPKVVEAISGYWEAIGVKTRITPLDYGTVRKAVAENKVRNVMISWRVSNTQFQHGLIYTLYHSKGRLTGLKPAPAELDKILDDLLTEVDLEAYGKIQYEAAKFIYDHYLAIPLMEVGILFAADPGKIRYWEPELNADEMAWQNIR
jgi:peptide/nickel transport system substrate-binding protein